MRHYTDYKIGDWVLWIEAELFHRTKIEDVAANIKILKSDGTTIEFPYLVRTPFNNTNIYQISRKSGNKRLKGIPLVFKSFEELSQIEEITIQWKILQYLYDANDEPGELSVDLLEVQYFTDFIKNEVDPDFRFYTIYSKDSVLNNEYNFNYKKVVKEEYINEFDYIDEFITLNSVDYHSIEEINKELDVDFDYEKIKSLSDNIKNNSDFEFGYTKLQANETIKAEYKSDLH